MKDKGIFIILVIYFLVALFVIYVFDGTGDAGDSIMHYLFAKYAPVHKELFFNHWAKPLYTLLASPFAQFGFSAIKLFNVIVSIVTMYYSYQSAKLLGLKNDVLVVVLLVFSPMYFALTFSGLTEPLFAMFLSLGLYFTLRQRYITSSIIISFLPFVRSEGLVIIGVFLLFLLIERRWKIIPYLIIGHLVYSIVGYFVHEDILWVFTKIPYRKLGSTYGSGSIFHIVRQLIYIVGVPIYALFWVGVVAVAWKSLKKTIKIETQVLVFLGAFAFIIAHSLFWYLGIFNSMGLKRVLIGIMPLIAIISLIGYNFISEDLLKSRRNPRLIFQGLILSYILVFPFTSNPAALIVEKDLGLSKAQISARHLVEEIEDTVGMKHRFVYSYPYFSEVLDIDYFDESRHVELTMDYLWSYESNDIIIWDYWFSELEKGVLKEDLDDNPDLINISSPELIQEGYFSIYKLR